MQSFCGQGWVTYIWRLCGERSRSYLGRSCFIPERVTVINRSEKSAEAVAAACMELRAERGRKPEVMSLKSAWHQKLGQLGLIEKRRVKPRLDLVRDEARSAGHKTGRLVAIGHTHRKPQLLEPPGADPHAGWCWKGNDLRCVPYPDQSAISRAFHILPY